MTKKSYKIRYILFILTVVVTIIANEAVLRYNLDLQDSDAKILNLAGRQRMLSQRITKHLLLMGDTGVGLTESYSVDSLTKLVNEFERGQSFLSAVQLEENNGPRIQTLLGTVGPMVGSIVESSRDAIQSGDSLTIAVAARSVVKIESEFLSTMEVLVLEYQKEAERKLARTKRITLLLSLVAIAVLLGEFIFIILPFFNDLFLKNKKLETANRKLSDFAYITSHNLRAPVSNLNSLLYFYKEVDDHAEKEELMGKFEIVIENLNLTMNTLLQALQVSSEKTEEGVMLTFQEILNKTVASISSVIDQNEAEILTDFSKVPNITYNRLYLESIFLNLITNSIRYRSEERAPVVRIRSFRKEGKVVLSFEDNGLGIDMEKHGKKLFGMNQTFHRHPDSKGVGLFMTRNQIEVMGGHIIAVSEVGRGTKFTITF